MDTDKLIELASNAWNESDKVKSVDYLLKAWDSLEEPKEQELNSFHICSYLIKLYLETKDFDLALKWAEQIQTCDLQRLDSGSREFIKGKVLFETGEIDKAKTLFEKANKLSFGRCFEGEHKKYKETLSKSKKKELTNAERIKKTDIEYLKKDYETSLNFLFDCLNNSENFEDAFLFLRKGQCHYELGQMKESADALAKAYFLKGGKIFKKEDNKYFEFLKTKLKNIEEPKKKMNLIKRVFGIRK